MGDKVNNVQALMNNPKQRNIYLMGVGVAVIALVAGFIYATSGNKNIGDTGGAQVAKIPSVSSTPGASTSIDYNRKVAEANSQKADSALAQGSSFVPTPIRQDALSTESPLDSLDKQIKAQKEIEAKEQAEKQVQPPIVEQPVAEVPPPMQPVQQVQAPVVVKPAPVKKYGSDEDYIIMQAITGVSTIKVPKSEFDYVGQKADNKSADMSQQAMQQMGQVSGSGQQVAQKGPLLAKAGTIFNAVLETGINSDEPSPVLAKIVSGDLKGTRLIGRISLSGEKVVVQFNTASIPDYPNSLKLNSVAVDPSTSRTGLASDVDRHYFLRYGVLLGSAFLGSYADALKNQNSTSTVTPEGAVITSTGPKSSKDMNREAIGGVGKELATETRQRTAGLKPTITVDAGIPIGILVMDDLYGQ